MSASGAVLMLGGMAGPFDILLHQHHELEDLLERLASEADAEELAHAQESLARLLRLHSRLEERCVQPLVTRVEGRARAREEAEDHLTLRELMEELQELTPRGVEWQARLFTLEDQVVAHVQAMEHGVLPRLSASLDAEELEELGHDLALTYEELLDRSQHPPASGRGALLEPLHWDA
ncbi:hemerythrin domain-containing protein [Corallococcus coralloides]|uniref:hemerythrin domain-containing protein n=1 Tax=Corallococcus coralloides TaxID=184914 RepID=UPI0038507395